MKIKGCMDPPGMALKREKIWFYVLLLAGLVHSLGFFAEYQRALEELYQQQSQSWMPQELIWMEDFYQMIDGRYLLFGAAILWCLASIGFRYRYYYQGSNSIYLMRRLSDRWELHRSCLVRPLQRILLCLVVMMAVLLISYGFYMHCTPTQWLRPDQWQKVWRAIL